MFGDLQPPTNDSWYITAPLYSDKLRRAEISIRNLMCRIHIIAYKFQFAIRTPYPSIDKKIYPLNFVALNIANVAFLFAVGVFFPGHGLVNTGIMVWSVCSYLYFTRGAKEGLSIDDPNHPSNLKEKLFNERFYPDRRTQPVIPTVVAEQ